MGDIDPDGWCMDQEALARRWRLSPRTLENWRRRGTGPRFFRIGGRAIRYRAEDVEAYEAALLRQDGDDGRTG